MVVSMKDHPFYERMRTVPLNEAASMISTTPVDRAPKDLRRRIFREFARLLLVNRAERKKYGFNSDSGGEIVRGLEQAYQAGVEAAKRELSLQTRKVGQIQPQQPRRRDTGPWKLSDD
ncbi:hypothetical protein [Mesorhizobium shangrilense]|uniref:ProQ/FinO domain-containing protein n=1 Tax=Mesorhizobium shangrilense TaxID=460060 RepID=A0ABV2DQC3_9HYPH